MPPLRGLRAVFNFAIFAYSTPTPHSYLEAIQLHCQPNNYNPQLIPAIATSQRQLQIPERQSLCYLLEHFSRPRLLFSLERLHEVCAAGCSYSSLQDQDPRANQRSPGVSSSQARSLSLSTTPGSLSVADTRPQYLSCNLRASNRRVAAGNSPREPLH